VVPTKSPSLSPSLKQKESLVTLQTLSPIWLQVVCEVWPWNVEPADAKLSFGRKLQKRWQPIGVLWLDEIYSEPIRLDVNDLTQATVRKH
jgi:hypothetical protein